MAAMQPGFVEYCSNMANRLAAVTPGARSDPFFVIRTLTHFLNGVDHPDNHRKHVVHLEGVRREAERKQRLTAINVERLAEGLEPLTALVEEISTSVGGLIERRPELKAKVARKRHRSRTRNKPRLAHDFPGIVALVAHSPILDLEATLA